MRKIVRIVLFLCFAWIALVAFAYRDSIDWDYFFPAAPPSPTRQSDLELEIAQLVQTATAQTNNSTGTAQAYGTQSRLAATRDALAVALGTAVFSATTSTQPATQAQLPSNNAVATQLNQVIETATAQPTQQSEMSNDDTEDGFLKILRDPIWQGIGGVIAIVGLGLGWLSYRRRP